jgi:hypothetical protein
VTGSPPNLVPAVQNESAGESQVHQDRGEIKVKDSRDAVEYFIGILCVGSSLTVATQPTPSMP